MTTLKEKIAVMQHFEDGGEVELSTQLVKDWELWECHVEPNFDWHRNNYRIKVTKPSINWDHVHERFVAIATDKDGESFMYRRRPSLQSIAWYHTWGRIIVSDTFASFTPGSCDWKDSLVERPL